VRPPVVFTGHSLVIASLVQQSRKLARAAVEDRDAGLIRLCGQLEAAGSGRSLFALEGTMWDQVGRLHAHHGDVPVEIRLLKLTEEIGEVADAFLGAQGLFSELLK
jgi:hypothetical protein